MSITKQRLNLNSLIDENVIRKMVDNKLKKMWGWFTVFGEFISDLLGIFFIWLVILTCINIGLNISLLYQTFGWSIQLIAVIFSSITHYIMHNEHKKQHQKKGEQLQQPLINATKTQSNVFNCII